MLFQSARMTLQASWEARKCPGNCSQFLCSNLSAIFRCLLSITECCTNCACMSPKWESRSSMEFEVVHDQSTWHLLSCPSKETIPISNAAWAQWEIVHFAHTRLLKFENTDQKIPSSQTIKCRLETLLSHTCLKYKGCGGSRSSKTPNYSITNCPSSTIEGDIFGCNPNLQY